MCLDSTLCPTPVTTRIEHHSARLKELETIKIALIDNFKSEMCPPSCNKAFVHQWYEQMNELLKQIDQTNQDFLQDLYKEFESYSQFLVDKLYKLKSTLGEKRYCLEEDSLDELLKKKCIPLMGEMQKSYERNLEYLDICFEWNHKVSLDLFLRSTVKFSHSLAKMWFTNGELELDNQAHNFKDGLNLVRSQMEVELKMREERFDIAVDALRQAPKEGVIAQALNDSVAQLEKMQISFENCQKQQNKLLKNQPVLLKECLNSYENVIYKFFGLERVKQEKLESGKYSDLEFLYFENSQFVVLPREQALNNYFGKATKKEDIDAREKLAATAYGILGETLPPEFSEPPTLSWDGSSIFANNQLKDFVNFNIVTCVSPLVPSSVGQDVTNFKKIIRDNFVLHAVKQRVQVMSQFEEEAASQVDLLEKEAHLRLQILETRARRAKEDIAHVRIAELSLHENRVERHLNAIKLSLNDARCNAVSDLETKLTESEQSFIVSLTMVKENLHLVNTSAK
ncbi:hypothetical protein Ciccas_000923 [Cichlidogyrus casuarinus]|uniref:DUF4455 domain-containing protein n=1 Tax=Cichlidogyrus casuarinus TaxID=1844966 RepID=A0ABD2QLJ1_9PLAT